MSRQFDGFSPDSFEQFIRALAVAVFGPGVTVFGNGPDGGREATFRGTVPYPHPPSEQWNGYGVIQAKFKERTETTATDQNWALKLLRDELDLFVNSAKRQPKPDYYVFATNVPLSSAAGGGIDSAKAIAESYATSLGLQGYAIWDGNELVGLVNTHENIRRKYRFELSPGELISAFLAQVEARTPNAAKVLTTFLERELRSDEAARLDQAGNRTDQQLHLSRLFFDLPATPEQSLTPPDETADENGRLPPGILSELLRAAGRKLDPLTLFEHNSGIIDGDKESSLVSQYLLLGGPGSGKSTVGQFLAQVHRAALLERVEPHKLQPSTLVAISEIRELCRRELFRWPAAPRYPFRIELNRFGRALAAKEGARVTTLASYLLTLLGHAELKEQD